MFHSFQKTIFLPRWEPSHACYPCSEAEFLLKNDFKWEEKLSCYQFYVISQGEVEWKYAPHVQQILTGKAGL